MTKKLIDMSDEFEVRGAKPYIYTKKGGWFIAWWTSEEKVHDNTPSGYVCNLYTHTSQMDV